MPVAPNTSDKVLASLGGALFTFGMTTAFGWKIGLAALGVTLFALSTRS